MVNTVHHPSDLLARYIAHWQLKTEGAPFYTASSVLQPVRWRGQSAMLKIALNEEEARGNRLMAWWNGRHSAQVFCQHGPALLMELLPVGPSLTSMAVDGEDEACVRILCRIATALHKQPHVEPPPTLVPLSQWFQALLLGAHRHETSIRQAAQLAARLLEQQKEAVVLHGDLHHGNVLCSASRSWLAIDPKGLYGERAFDYANLFCNPTPPLAMAPGRFEQLLVLVEEETQLARQLLLSWIAAWAGLSVVWHREDGTEKAATLFVLHKALNLLALPFE